MQKLENIYSFEFLPDKRPSEPISVVEIYVQYSISTQKWVACDCLHLSLNFMLSEKIFDQNPQHKNITLNF